MEKLLHWSIEAAKNPETAGNPDPELISKLFSGYDDHTAMKVNLQEAVEGKDLDKRLEALEVFEELVENVDNANDLGNLWAPLLFLCQDQEPKVRQLALSSVAYAVQNNDKSQQDLLNTKQGIPILMAACTDPNDETAAKALFSVAAAIGHNPENYDSFAANKGLEMTNKLAQTLPDDGQYTRKDLKYFSLVYALLNLEPRRHTKASLVPVIAKIEALKPDSQGKISALLDLAAQHHNEPAPRATQLRLK